MDFDMLGLAPRLTRALADQGLTQPTPIQTQAIPHAMNGKDVMGLAQTGTGKTAAFGLPMIHALLTAGTKPEAKTVRGLILAPTRELAKQITDNLRAYTEGSHLKVQLVVGGVGLGPQVKRLERGADLLVATPGRLLDLLDRKAMRLDETQFLVLDEADQMLDLGFIHALRKITSLLPAQRQTMLFSATMPKQMEEIAGKYLTNPVRVQVSPPGKTADKVTQKIHFIAQAEKSKLLIELLGEHRKELAIVFSRTKHGAEKLMKSLVNAGFTAVSVHGNKSQGQRTRALEAFKAEEAMIMVATDVAARGLDIPGVRHVYNFDLPNVAENYVHRIGRTARAGRDGAAIAFCAPDEIGCLKDIEKVIKLDIPVASGRRWEPSHGDAAKPSGRSGGGRRGGPGGQGRGPAKGGAPKAGKPKPQGKPGGPRRNKRPSGGGRSKTAA